MNKTLEDAFRDLVKRRKWYEHSLKSSIQAKSDKSRFLKGKNLPEERIRDYLAAAGWISIKNEEWNMPGITLTMAFRELVKMRQWYKCSCYSPSRALKDKSRFLKGQNVPEKRMRNYLLSAGIQCIQVEKWMKL